ncbi:MAG: EipA family protein [Pseudomonadota bacterium]
MAQVRTIDPNQAIDSDLNHPQTAPTPAPQPYPNQTYPNQTDPGQPVPSEQPVDPGQQVQQNSDPAATAGPATSARADANHDAATDTTFHRPEILGAAENTFGKGAAGLAGIIERTLKDQGEPNAYISGREGSGAVVVGLRYGAGTLFHKVEGPMPVHWTGPSVGFDVGGDASKVFVLVYNLYDSEELFRRFPAGEGKLYVIGGFTASYLRRGNIVLIPIRLGVGWRQGVNLGYMKFSHKGRIIPF